MGAHPRDAAIHRDGHNDEDRDNPLDVDLRDGLHDDLHGVNHGNRARNGGLHPPLQSGLDDDYHVRDRVQIHAIHHVPNVHDRGSQDVLDHGLAVLFLVPSEHLCNHDGNHHDHLAPFSIRGFRYVQKPMKSGKWYCYGRKLCCHSCAICLHQRNRNRLSNGSQIHLYRNCKSKSQHSQRYNTMAYPLDGSHDPMHQR